MTLLVQAAKRRLEEPKTIANKLTDPDPQALLESCRAPNPASTPDWVRRLSDSLGGLIMERHHYKEGKVWGLAQYDPGQGRPFNEVGTCEFLGAVFRRNMQEQVPGYSEQAVQQALEYWQSWQDPKTGRFHDPDDPDRTVNEKYVVGLIGTLGGRPLYPHTTTSATGKIDTAVFLRRTKDDPDWEHGGWGVGSQSGFMAVEIYNAINRDGREELIGDLQEGIANILSHQDPASGLWGPPAAPLDKRIGGTLKVIVRLHGRMGLVVPNTKELADTLIERQKTGEFHACSVNDCPQHNQVWMLAYCLETLDHRRAELRDSMASVAQDLRAWVSEDGGICRNRGNRGGAFSVIIAALGICGAYLNWQDCPFPNPAAGLRRGAGDRYRVALTDRQQVEIVKRST